MKQYAIGTGPDPRRPARRLRRDRYATSAPASTVAPDEALPLLYQQVFSRALP